MTRVLPHRCRHSTSATGVIFIWGLSVWAVALLRPASAAVIATNLTVEATTLGTLLTPSVLSTSTVPLATNGSSASQSSAVLNNVALSLPTADHAEIGAQLAADTASTSSRSPNSTTAEDAPKSAATFTSSRSTTESPLWTGSASQEQTSAGGRGGSASSDSRIRSTATASARLTGPSGTTTSIVLSESISTASQSQSLAASSRTETLALFNATETRLPTSVTPTATATAKSTSSDRVNVTASASHIVTRTSAERLASQTRSRSSSTATDTTVDSSASRTSSRTASSRSTGRSSSTKLATIIRVTSTSTRTSSTAKPSPTRYGDAPSHGCIKPPSTFDGTDAGFKNLCHVRYCDAEPRRNMVWNGNSGNVTRTEIETALGMLRELEPLWENGQGNVLADGTLGQGMHDAGLLFEITGDRRALDVIVNIADNILALQNANTPDPVTIWTGAKDSVWPTGDLYPEDGKLVYAGCEQGAIAGNMATAAVYILKIPCLWDMVPPVFQGPTIFSDSTTYYNRAQAYIAAADDTFESFFWRFLDSNRNLINPADERWWLVGDTRAPGTPMPWNRGMMMVLGYLRLAAAHETTAAYDANRTAYYDAISGQHIGNFIRDLNETKAIRNGVTTFSWDYSYGEDNTEESQGVHAYYDIWGSWLGWQRNPALFGLFNYIGATFAATFQNTISLGNGSFSGLVTGSSSTQAYTINRLYGGWSFYALWLPEWFDTIATANVETGFSGRTWLAIPLLWTKHALAKNDVTFWASELSSGFGVIAGTKASAAATPPSPSGSWNGAQPSALCATTLALIAAITATVFLAAV